MESEVVGVVGGGVVGRVLLDFGDSGLDLSLDVGALASCLKGCAIGFEFWCRLAEEAPQDGVDLRVGKAGEIGEEVGGFAGESSGDGS